MGDQYFQNSNMITIRYELVREAFRKTLGDGLYTMSLVSLGEIGYVMQAVNMGIDSHLEACYVPDRGDKYQFFGNRLFCKVSAESLPVLLRRLCEEGEDPDGIAMSLAESILSTIGITETGEYKPTPEGD